MTLTELKEYVQAAAHCLRTGNRNAFPGSSPSVIEPMARRWIDKGLMAKVDMDGTKCGGCTACADVSNVTTNGSVLNR